MAGAGWRQFSDGAVLTAAQIQAYLQDQAVQVFASAATRSAALGTSVATGMLSFRADGTALEVYQGGSWVGVPSATVGTANDTNKLNGRTVTVGTAAPGSPANGDIWINI